jgi:hypothetical protein
MTAQDERQIADYVVLYCANCVGRAQTSVNVPAVCYMCGGTGLVKVLRHSYSEAR